MTFAFYIKIEENKTEMEEKTAVKQHIPHLDEKTMAFVSAKFDLQDLAKSHMPFVMFSTSIFLIMPRLYLP